MDPTAPGNGQDESPTQTQTVPDSQPLDGSVSTFPTEPTNEPQNPPQMTEQSTQSVSDPQTPRAGSQAGQESVNNQPQTYTSQVQSPQEAVIDDSPKKSRRPLLFLILIFFLILTISGLGGLTYAVAYEKIKLDKYPDLQKQVSYFVMELPFMPKTAKFLLAKSALAHQDITRQTFDVSVAVDSADLSSSLGLSNMDIQAKGAFDYTDPKNVFGSIELSFTKDFNMELKKKDEMLYFKLNKLPSFLFAFLGIGTANFEPITNKWVAYDTTPLDTEARRSIQEDREVDPLSEEFIDKNFEKYIDDMVLSKMQLSSDTEEGHSVHKITLDTDKELIDHLGKKIEEASRQKSNYVYPQSDSNDAEKLSDFIKRLKWEMYIDKETYYTRKVILSIDLEYDSSDGLGAFSLGSLMNPLPSNNSAKVVLAAKFDKFGEEVIVEEPSEFITLEEFTNLLSSALNEIYGGAFESSRSQTGDSKRIADLATLRATLEMYKTDCGKYPSDLSDMTHSAGSENCQYQSNIGSYILIIPTDPDGSNYYYMVSDNGNSYDLCANLDTPVTIQIACPDPSYNYHLREP